MDTRDMSIRERLDHVAKVLDSLAAPQVIEITIYRPEFGTVANAWLKDADEFRRVLVGREAWRDRQTWECMVDGVRFQGKEQVPERVIERPVKVQL